MANIDKVKLKRLKELLKLVDEGLTKEEFVTSFKNVVKIVVAIREQNKKVIDLLQQVTDIGDLETVVRAFDNAGVAIQEKVTQSLEVSLAKRDNENQTFNKLDREKLEKEIKEALAKALEDQATSLNFIHDKVSKLRDGKDADEAKLFAKLLEAIPDIPDIPEIPKAETGGSIADKLEAMIDGKLSIDAIDELREILEDLQKRFKTGNKIVTGRYVHTPIVDRLTDLTDGSTKTFLLSKAPKDTATMEVFGTDFPIILDPTVDFTVSGKTLTLTDAVDAPMSGSTLICKYYI